MSKPPFKSGGPKRGGGGSRDGSFRDGPRGGSRSSGQRGGARGDAPRGDAPSGRGARGDSRREGQRDDARSDARGAARGERPAFGRGPRNSADSKSFGNKPYGERKSGEYRSDDRPRGDRNRDDRAPGRNEGQRGDRPTYGRGPRKADDGRSFGERPSGGRSSGGRSGEREGGDRPRSARPYGERSRDERGGNERYGSDRYGNDRYAGAARSDERRNDERRARPARPVRTAPRAAAPTAKTPGMPVREGERIAKLLARAGVASRREAERLIIEGRVRLGEDLIETPSTVLPNLRGVTVDGNPVKDAEETRLFIFHKPSGLITAERDPVGRPTIYTALRNALPEGAGRVMPIGRLDLNTEGLLLLTNDGEFKRQLELPATGVPRTYRARTFGDITQDQLEDLIEGIEIEGVVYGKIDANMERRTGRNQWIEMTLTEGKNREVRRVLEHLGLQVSRLIRTSYGPFRLLDLPKGMVVEVSERELENFRRTLPDAKA
ncbi:pseudouridine synthase [Novosphingobium sp. BL-8A]|uniref:pseudouridine synthase n=1 Tax=Novosphingobium sp. BL-8A TaxID=3127639 RepID=UPI00375676AB